MRRRSGLYRELHKAPQGLGRKLIFRLCEGEYAMRNIVYIVGLIVIVLVVLSFLGLR